MKGQSTFNEDAELASDTGRELWLPALTHQIFPITVYGLPTQHGYCVGVSLRIATGTASEGLAQGPYVAARAGFEPATLRTKGVESTNEQPRHNESAPVIKA